MSEEQQGNGLKDRESQPEYRSWRAERHNEQRLRREELRAGRPEITWIFGGVLIIIGIFVLLQNMKIVSLNNWWAFFILIPAIGAFASAWRAYQNTQGHLTVAARGSLMVGFILTMVTAIFLFNLNWMILGPVLLILAGIGILINAIIPG